MLKKDHLNNISSKDIFLFINSEFFQSFFTLFIIILFMESIGFTAVDSQVLLQIIIILLIIFSFIEVIFNSKDLYSEKKSKNKIVFFIIFLALFAGFFIYLKLVTQTNLALIIAIFVTVLIFLLSYYLVLENDN